MRPRPEGRGEPCLTWISGTPASLASMRPRPEGRGERGSRSRMNTATAWLQCGHDPKAVENDASVQANPGFPSRFNAATTRRPWRTWPAVGEAGRNWSFNAATTRRPWRTRPDRSGASAGRRWLQCGHDPKAVENRKVFADLPVIRELQCGHDPKAVENASRAASAASRAVELQCGHDPKAVENAHVLPSAAAVPRASMRPRPEGRGEPCP